MESPNNTKPTDTQTSDQLQTRVPRSPSKHTFHADYFERVLKILVIAIAFVKFVLKDQKILSKLDVDKLEVVSPHFFDFKIDKESYADMIYKIPLKGDDSGSVTIFILLEHKSYYDPMVVFQLGYYTMQVLIHEVDEEKKNPANGKSSPLKARLPLTIPIVVYNGKEKFKGPRQLKDLFPQLELDDKHLLNYEPIIIDFNEVNVEDIPHEANEIRPYVVLKSLKLLCDGFSPEKAAECIKQLLPYTYNSQEYIEFTHITLTYFMSVLNNSKSWLEQIIKENKEYECQQHIDANHGGTNLLLSIKDQYIEEGYKQGYNLGIEQGIERSVIANRQTLLAVLKNRFYNVPMSIQENIESIHDSIYLQTLIIEAASCQSLEEFRESLL